MQPYHAIDDGRWAEKVIGHERAKTTYAFRSLLDAHARLAFGSDWFVAPADAARGDLRGRHASHARRQASRWLDPGAEDHASRRRCAPTRSGAAYASFAEKEKGTLAPGMLADFVIIDRDLTRIAPETIRDAKIVMTVVGGKAELRAGRTAVGSSRGA